MPVFLLDTNGILPLPSIQAYTTTSFIFLSFSIYYAIQVASEPNWKSKAKLNFTFNSDLINYGFDELEKKINLNNDFIDKSDSFKDELIKAANKLATKEQEQLNKAIKVLNYLLDHSVSERILDVIYIMFHEPLCFWTVINIAFCYLLLIGKFTEKIVFGQLRVSERQNFTDRIWNYIFLKFIIVFFVISNQFMEEVLLWCSWFSVLAFLSMLTQLSKDRFEYLSISPTTSNWTHFKLLTLLIVIIIQSSFMFLISCFIGYYFGLSIFIFMVSECLLTFIRAMHLLIRYIVYLTYLNQNSSCEKRSSFSYYLDFVFELILILINFVYYFHLIFWEKTFISLTNIIIFLQLRNLFNEFKKRIKKHKNYLQVIQLMEKNFPMATKEELAKISDDCPICWDKMETGRKLPCGHFFHNYCLRSWLQQDTSCPTCRKSLKNQIEGPRTNSNPTNFNITISNRFYHFDGPRYASWLPSVAVQLTSQDNTLNINTNANLNENQSPTMNNIDNLNLDAISSELNNIVSNFNPNQSSSSSSSSSETPNSTENFLENLVNSHE